MYIIETTDIHKIIQLLLHVTVYVLKDTFCILLILEIFKITIINL
jgi:hypothetical protein